MLVLTEDLQARIFFRLNLADVASLRRVSRHFQRIISNDKVLWANILNHEVLTRYLSLHPSRIDISFSTSAQIESWLRFAILLHRSYSQETKLEKTRTKIDLGITWLKIARARWCIIASSNIHQSRLSICGLSGGMNKFEDFYLPGPVLSGIQVDSDLGLKIALTIGTAKPRILIVELGTSEGQIKVHHLTTLEGFAYAVYFSETRLVCGAKDGDDTYPYLLDWRNGRHWKLVPQVQPHISQKDFQENMNAISSTEWEGLTVVILNKTIQFFRTTHLDENPHPNDDMSAIWTCMLEFDDISGSDRGFVVEATFENGADRRTREGAPLLLFAGRRRDLHSFTGAITLEKGEGDEKRPQLVELCVADYYYSDGDEEGDKTDLCPEFPLAIRSTVGHSFGHVLQVIQSKEAGNRPLEFLILSWSKLASKQAGRPKISTLTTPTKVNSSGLPLLEFLSCIDFDDAAGLIVIGTSRGEACLVKFLPEMSWVPGAIETSLPVVLSSASDLSKYPVTMDLDDYYGYLADVQAGTMPRTLRDVTLATWMPRYERGELSPEWSQEWASYEHVDEWISPWSRWLASNLTYERNRIGRGISEAYHTLCAKGKIVPVAFRVVPPERSKDNEEVLIRIGKRLYVVYLPIDISETIDIIALPVNFDDIFDARMIQGFCVRVNWLEDWIGNGGAYALGRHTERAEKVLKFIGAHPQVLTSAMPNLEPNPELWKRDQRRTLENILDDLE